MPMGVVFSSHNVCHAMAVGDRFTVLNRGKTRGTATRGEITAGLLQDLMAGRQELAQLEGRLGGTVQTSNLSRPGRLLGPALGWPVCKIGPPSLD